MNEKKLLFVVSDIHGHYTPLKKALDEAGFDENNERHVLICCGDLFDRGNENRKVYDYIKKLPRKVLVRGNHDERLMEILTDKRADPFELRHGLDLTLREFFGMGSVGAYGELRLPESDEMSGELCNMIAAMLDYYETENYIFVHGWLPTVRGERPPRLLENWRQAPVDRWQIARISDWNAMYRTAAMPDEKTVICGHSATTFATRFDPKRSGTDSSIFYGDGLIAIDACTVRSGRVNVLVLEEKV